MVTETEQWIASWERRRVSGVWLYILQWALAFCGVGLLFSALDWYFDDHPFDAIRLLRHAISGLCVGAWSWFWKEHKYRERTGSRSDSDA